MLTETAQAKFIESVSGTLIAVASITSIEPYKGGWGHVVYYGKKEQWRWVHPDVIADLFGDATDTGEEDESSTHEEGCGGAIQIDART